MIRFLFIALLSYNLYAYDDTDTKTALESLVIKAGIESLVNEFEKEKNTTRQHSSDIEELKQNVKFLMAQSLKNKFGVETTIQTTPTKQDDIEALKAENQKLKEQIKQIQSLKQNYTITYKKNRAKVVVKKSAIYQQAHSNALILRYVYTQDILKIEHCDKYGWCKLKNHEEYIPKYKLKLLNNP